MEREEETLEVVSPDGDVEVSIRLSPEGPVLKLRGARLEIESTDVVAVNCRRLALRVIRNENVLHLRT